MRKTILAVLVICLATGAAFAAGISPEEVREMTEEGIDFVIIDIRSADEYMAGHLSGARHAVWNGSGFESGYTAYISSFSMPVVVVCTDGSISAAAAEALECSGYNAVCHLEGGMLAGDGILAVSNESNIKSWHVIKSLFSNEMLPRHKRM